MSRTILDITISNKSVEEVKNKIYKWFEENSFAILTLNSDGSELKFSGTRINPDKGKLIALNQKDTGSIILELEIHPNNNHTIVHSEFYVPGAGPWAGKEMELNSKAIVGGLPKRR